MKKDLLRWCLMVALATGFAGASARADYVYNLDYSNASEQQDPQIIIPAGTLSGSLTGIAYNLYINSSETSSFVSDLRVAWGLDLVNAPTGYFNPVGQVTSSGTAPLSSPIDASTYVFWVYNELPEWGSGPFVGTLTFLGVNESGGSGGGTSVPDGGSTLAFLGLGLLGLGALRRRRA